MPITLSNERLDSLISAYGKMSFERTYAEIAAGLSELKRLRAEIVKRDAEIEAARVRSLELWRGGQ